MTSARHRSSGGQAETRTLYGRSRRESPWRNVTCDDDYNAFGDASNTAHSGAGGIFKSAAIEVLKMEKRLMSTGEITKLALERKLVKCQGKTPENTMASALYTDVRKRGNYSPFIKPKEGLFGLKTWLNENWLQDWLSKEGISISDFLPDFQQTAYSSEPQAVSPPTKKARTGPSSRQGYNEEGGRSKSQRNESSGDASAENEPSEDTDSDDKTSNLNLLLEAADEIDKNIAKPAKVARRKGLKGNAAKDAAMPSLAPPYYPYNIAAAHSAGLGKVAGVPGLPPGYGLPGLQQYAAYNYNPFANPMLAAAQLNPMMTAAAFDPSHLGTGLLSMGAFPDLGALNPAALQPSPGTGGVLEPSMSNQMPSPAVVPLELQGRAVSAAQSKGKSQSSEKENAYHQGKPSREPVIVNLPLPTFDPSPGEGLDISDSDGNHIAESSLADVGNQRTADDNVKDIVIEGNVLSSEKVLHADLLDHQKINLYRQHILFLERVLGNTHPQVGKAYIFLTRVLQHEGSRWSLTMAQRALLRSWQILASMSAKIDPESPASLEPFTYLMGNFQESQSVQHWQQAAVASMKAHAEAQQNMTASQQLAQYIAAFGAPGMQ